MKTSLNELKTIEAYLTKSMAPENRILFEAQLLLHTDLREQVSSQKKTYALVQEYSRKQLKAEIEAVHQQLFTRPQYSNFRKAIMELFTR